jgi:mannose-6-phosphate isomerase
MNKIYKLKNQFKHYKWGSLEEIPLFLGMNNTKKEPYAEMWIGTHNDAPSQAEENGSCVLLKEIAGELPFLFKLIAVQSPLSVQVHPDKEQAQAGYKLENEIGISLDDPKRNYKDPHQKNEILCALTPFTLIAGFKDPKDVYSSFGTMSLELQTLIKNLEDLYPKDPAVYSPLYFNYITLQPGQAVYIPAGIPHFYIKGLGLELMNNSDNVLRGGLTSKYIDIDELMKIIKLKPFSPEIITPSREARFTYPVPCKDFSLSFLRSVNTGVMTLGETGPALCIVTEGEMLACGKTFKKGASFFVPKEARDIQVNGVFSLFIASSVLEPSIKS